MRKIRISELPLSTSLKGLFTIGTDKDDASAKVSLESIEEATDTAKTDAANAQAAADAAHTRLDTDEPVIYDNADRIEALEDITTEQGEKINVLKADIFLARQASKAEAATAQATANAASKAASAAQLSANTANTGVNRLSALAEISTSDTAIDTLQEVYGFLEGYSQEQTLSAIISSLAGSKTEVVRFKEVVESANIADAGTTVTGGGGLMDSGEVVYVKSADRFALLYDGTYYDTWSLKERYMAKRVHLGEGGAVVTSWEVRPDTFFLAGCVLYIRDEETKTLMEVGRRYFSEITRTSIMEVRQGDIVDVLMADEQVRRLGTVVKAVNGMVGTTENSNFADVYATDGQRLMHWSLRSRKVTYTEMEYADKAEVTNLSEKVTGLTSSVSAAPITVTYTDIGQGLKEMTFEAPETLNGMASLVDTDNNPVGVLIQTGSTSTLTTVRIQYLFSNCDLSEDGKLIKTTHRRKKLLHRIGAIGLSWYDWQEVDFGTISDSLPKLEAMPSDIAPRLEAQEAMTGGKRTGIVEIDEVRQGVDLPTFQFSSEERQEGDKVVYFSKPNRFLLMRETGGTVTYYPNWVDEATWGTHGEGGRVEPYEDKVYRVWGSYMAWNGERLSWLFQQTGRTFELADYGMDIEECVTSLVANGLHISVGEYITEYGVPKWLCASMNTAPASVVFLGPDGIMTCTPYAEEDGNGNYVQKVSIKTLTFADAGKVSDIEKEVAGISTVADWLLFPMEGEGADTAVSVNGINTLSVSRTGFRIAVADKVITLWSPLEDGVSISFSAGESGYIVLNMDRLVKMNNTGNISVLAGLEKMVTPAIFRPGTHVPVAYCQGGQKIWLLGQFADIFGGNGSGGSSSGTSGTLTASEATAMVDDIFS